MSDYSFWPAWWAWHATVWNRKTQSYDMIPYEEYMKMYEEYKLNNN